MMPPKSPSKHAAPLQPGATEIDPTIDLLPLSDFQKRVFTKAVRLVLEHPKFFADAARRLDGGIAAWQKENNDQPPDAALVWVVDHTIVQISHGHFPAGAGREDHARKLLYLALVAFHPPGAKRLGQIARREWDGDIIALLAGADLDALAGPIPKHVRRRWRENARTSFETAKMPRQIGREVIAFRRNQARALYVRDDLKPHLDTFAKVVNKAVAVLGGVPIAEPNEEAKDGSVRSASDEPTKHSLDDLLSAEDYRVKYGLPPDRLAKARRDGRLTGEKRHGRWYYSKAAVSAIWPDVFMPEE